MAKGIFLVKPDHPPENPSQISGEAPFKLSLKFAFEPRDLWLGVYIGHSERIAKVRKNPRHVEFWNERKVYLCLIPMLPIILVIRSDRRGHLHPTGRTADVHVEHEGSDKT
jgi:hypothetical protein